MRVRVCDFNKECAFATVPSKEVKTIHLHRDEEFIKLGQLLKYAGIIERGSDAKDFLSSNLILVNGTMENRRGAKIRPGSVVVIGSLELKICGSEI